MAVRSASSSEERDVRELFDQQYRPMVELAYRIVGNRAEAEEVVQDAFVEIVRRWRSILNPGGYLRVSVANGARRVLRQRDRQRNALPTNDEAVLMSDSNLYLLDALDQLPERHRTALVLAYYGDFSIAEIAQALGCRPGTAKSLVHRGVRRLRKELDDDQ